MKLKPFSKISHSSILLLLLLAFWLRTYQLDTQSLRGDEAATVLYSALPVTQLWEHSRVTDPHPPLYYLMLNPWQRLFGEAAWMMRFAGVIASTLTVAALYRLARRTRLSAGIALLAALLLAVNPLQIWLAQDVRSYPFFTLLGLLSSWALWQALHGSQQLAVSSQQSAGSGQPVASSSQDVADSSQPVASSSQQSAGSGQPVASSSQVVADSSQPKTSHNQSRNTQHVSHITYHASRITHHSSRNSQFAIHNSQFIIQSPWLLYILTTLACFYIHYYTVFLIAFQGLFVLVNARKFWYQKWPWLASQIIIALLMIPGLQLAYNFVGQAAGGIETISTTDLLQQASTALLTGFTIADSWGLGVSLALAPLWIIGAIILVRQNFTSGTFWALFFAVPVLGVLALSIDRPFFKERFLIQAQPALELLLAAGFFTLWRKFSSFPLAGTGGFPPGGDRRVSGFKFQVSAFTFHVPRPTHHASRITHHATRLTALLLLLLLLTTNTLSLINYFADPAYAKAPPWHLYHDYVQRKAQPGDVMLTNFPEASVSYYSPNGLPFYVVPVERDRSVSYRLEQTEQIAGAYERIWFLPLLRQGFDEQGDVLNWLERHADRINQIFLPGYHLNLYLSPATLEERMIPQPVSFAHGLHLRGFQILDQQGKSRLDVSGDTPTLTLAPEETFTLSLYWQTDAPTNTPYTVFTHLIAADGFNRISQDNQPVWGSYATTRWSPGEKITDKYTLLIPPGTPPGDHRLRVGWYQADTLARVPVLNESGQPAADHLILDVIIRIETTASAKN